MFKHKKEKLSNEFTKHHLELTGKNGHVFRPVIHHFTDPDKGGPHDHPWNFTTHILKGGYIERRYFINPDGTWYTEDKPYEEGTSHRIEAGHIHEIIALPFGECYTMVIADWPPKQWRFWQFEESGVKSRLPREKKFTDHFKEQTGL